MSGIKRIDYPCPWCGTRCCAAESGRREWACGSTHSCTGIRWQSAACRNQEIDNDSPKQLKQTIKRLQEEITWLKGCID